MKGVASMLLLARKGFTRLEAALGLCVVSAVIVFAVPPMWRGINHDRPHRAVLDAKVLAAAVIDYRAETGRWPTRDDGAALDARLLTEAPGRRLGAATAAPLAGSLTGAGDDRISRPWLDAIPVDPWGRAFRVRLTTDAEGYPAVAVVSAGPDGIFQTPAGDAPRGFAADDIGIVLIDQTDGGSRP
jgi:hypothetical protein